MGLLLSLSATNYRRPLTHEYNSYNQTLKKSKRDSFSSPVILIIAAGLQGRGASFTGKNPNLNRRNSTKHGVSNSFISPSVVFSNLCACTHSAECLFSLTVNDMNCYTSVRAPVLPNVCFHLRETTAKGTGLAKSAGKEDPIEIDSSLTPTIDG
ncbi:hypothetical protein G9A89_015315 [Geosiphon pyriformis]|nr:hypothetical protein G9A89_015315 [Geosiphon pyriformis]